MSQEKPDKKYAVKFFDMRTARMAEDVNIFCIFFQTPHFKNPCLPIKQPEAVASGAEAFPSRGLGMRKNLISQATMWIN